MAKARNNPAANYAQRQVASTEEMADLARRSGFNWVAGNLDNLAENRRTAAGMPPKPKAKPITPPAPPGPVAPPKVPR